MFFGFFANDFGGNGCGLFAYFFFHFRGFNRDDNGFGVGYYFNTEGYFEILDLDCLTNLGETGDIDFDFVRNFGGKGFDLEFI